MTLVVIAVNAGVIATGLREVLIGGGCELVSLSAESLVASLDGTVPDVVVVERDEPAPSPETLRQDHPSLTVVVVSVEDESIAVFPARDGAEPYTTSLTEDHLVAAALRP